MYFLRRFCCHLLRLDSDVSVFFYRFRFFFLFIKWNREFVVYFDGMLQQALALRPTPTIFFLCLVRQSQGNYYLSNEQGSVIYSNWIHKFASHVNNKWMCDACANAKRIQLFETRVASHWQMCVCVCVWVDFWWNGSRTHYTHHTTRLMMRARVKIAQFQFHLFWILFYFSPLRLRLNQSSFFAPPSSVYLSISLSNPAEHNNFFLSLPQ